MPPIKSKTAHLAAASVPDRAAVTEEGMRLLRFAAEAAKTRNVSFTRQGRVTA